MQPSTSFKTGDILVDYQGKYHYLLLSYIKTSVEWDFYNAILLEKNVTKVWGFNHYAYEKVA